MKTSSVINATLALAALVASATSALAQPTADDVLVDLSYNAVAEWTDFTLLGNPTLDADTVAAVSDEAIGVWSPGFQASSGLYSWMGDFGVTIDAEPVYSGGFTSAKTVVLQLAGAVVNGYIEDEDFDNTAEDHLYLEGGPLLYYTLADNTTGSISPTLAGVLGEAPGTAHGVGIDYVGFTWVWNLTSITTSSPVVSVSIDAPILNHSSTLGAQIAFGGTYDSSFFTTHGGTVIP